MTIRPATAADVPNVLPMVAAIAALHESWDPARYGALPDVAASYRGWLTSRSRDPRSVFLVAEREPGTLIGFLIAQVEHNIPIYRVGEYGFVHDLWVEPAYRNEGVARQMVMLAVERFTEIGVKQIRLETAATNEVARKLFASCGFRVSSIEMMLEIGDVKRDA
jgi:ribosomal protein S18 acetylase RimI-like enzyme